MVNYRRSQSIARLAVWGVAAAVVLSTQSAHAAKMIGYWESYGNIPLANVSSNYDIINLAFASPSGPAGAFVTWGQSVESDAQFRADIQTLHSRGKKVVLSIGGGGAAPLNLQNSGDVSNFVTDVENLCSSYGFDGIDLDDESGVFNLQSGDNDFTNPTTPTIKNYISGAQQIASHFGSGFIVSMANQTNDIDAYGAYGYDANNGVTWGSYLPIVYGMRNYSQIVETQCYNTGSVYARNGQLVNEGSPDLDVALSEMLMLGYHMGNGQNFPAIPQAEVAFGVPATSNAADAASWQSPQGVLNAAKYLGSGTPAGGSYGLEGGPYPNFAGVMTWDINYDQNQNQGLASTLHPYLSSIGGSTTVPEAPYTGTPIAIPGTLQVENYDVGGEGVSYHDSDTVNSGGQYRSDGVDIEACTDTGGGYDVGWTNAGEWMKYTVNVATAGTYTVTFRVADGGTANGSFHLANSSGTTLCSGTIAPTGGWQTWANVTATVTLPAGQQILTFDEDSSNFNINYIGFTYNQPVEGPYGGTPWAIPGTVQAENFDVGGEGVAYHDVDAANLGGQYRTTDGVDIEACTDTGGGYDVGWNSVGEWQKYTVNVATAGTYTVTFRVSNGATANGTLHLQNSAGTNLTGTVTVAPTGGWQTWTNVTANVTLPAGQQILQISDDGSNYNINYMTFAAVGPTIPAAPTGLTGTAGNTLVNLSWNTSTGATSYNVYSNGTLKKSGITTNSTQITGLTDGTSYPFTVAAVNSAGTSGMSNQISLTPTGGTSEGPYGGTPAAIPGTVQAENYDTGGEGVAYHDTEAANLGGQYRTTDGVDIEACTDTGGGYDVGWTNAGEYMKYTVNVATAGSYTVTFRVANGGTANGTFHLTNASGTNLTGAVTVAPTGGWQTWANVTATVTLPAGQQILTLAEDSANFNINYMAFAAASSGLPDLIVTSISWSPTSPTSGSHVVWSCVVKNQGTGATPAGTIVGVQFAVDGATTPINWSDNDTSSLAPGASVTLTATGGTNGVNYWPATSGTHTILAWVDDVNRIAESNENNNKLTVTVTVP